MDGPLASRRIVRSGDPDAVRDATGSLTVEHDIAVRRGGHRIDGLVNGARLGRVNVVFVRYGADVDVEAPPTGERLAMTIPLGPMRVAWPGRPAVVKRHGFSLDDELPTAMTPSPWAGAIVIATDLVVIEDHLRVLCGPPAARPLRFLPHGAIEPVLGPSLSEVTWRWVLAQLEGIGPQRLQGAAGRHLEDALLGSLLLGLPHTATAMLREDASPEVPPAIDRAREYLEANYSEPLSTADVARAVGVSIRYLQTGFRRRLGKTPMEVLREIRLQHVRQGLLEEARRRERTITDIAVQAGFSHLGRFAGQYRDRFGETPSQTVNGPGRSR